MFESKYSKVLTVILVIVVVAIIGLLGFLGYDYYKKYVVNSDAEDFVNNFTQEQTEGPTQEPNDDDAEEQTGSWDDIDLSGSETPSGSSSTNAKPTYKGFTMLGTIEIPATNCKYPILEKPTTQALDTGIVFVWGAGVNEVGNTILAGHNYRNGLFFSNNKKLNIGDKIKLTDNSKKTVTYTIYNKFETTDSDTSFYQRDTAGKPEITLSTCTDDGKNRLIILARVD